ncbi:STAS domain-containing protein [Noviherbaspirillum agri]
MYRPAQTLTVHNAKTVLDAGLRAIEGGEAQFDLGELTVVDSAAVATLLAWQRAAQRQGSQLTFQNFPSNLQSLVDLYGITELLHSTSIPQPRTDLPHH